MKPLKTLTIMAALACVVPCAVASPAGPRIVSVSPPGGSTLTRGSGVTFDVTSDGILEKLDVTIAVGADAPWLSHSLSSDSTVLAAYFARTGNPKAEGVVAMGVDFSSPTRAQWNMEFNTAHSAWQAQLNGKRTVDITLTATVYNENTSTHSVSVTYRVMNAVPADYDGDGLTDRSVYRENGKLQWVRSQSGDTVGTTHHAVENAYPVVGDFDGDGLCDRGWFRKGNVGRWTIVMTTRGVLSEFSFGAKNSLPAVGDYDGDGIDDLAVILADGRLRWWESSSPNNWLATTGSTKIIKTTAFGLQRMRAAPGDYDGDGLCDRAWFDPAKAEFTIVKTSSGGKVLTHKLGGSGAFPVPGDYDGDGLTDLAVMDSDRRVSWLCSSSGDTVRRKTSATAAWLNKYKRAVFAPGDYNGDGISDLVWYLDTGVTGGGTWHMRRSKRTPTSVTFSAFNTFFGAKGSIPVTGPRVGAPVSAHQPIIMPADFNGTLWKTPNHSGSGTVVLVASSFMADYQAGLWSAAVVSRDPAGDNVLPLGNGRIVDPYHERPAIRFDTLGTTFRPGPVYFVIKYKDGRRYPWYLPDPGVRTE
ncbi:MAG: VCBS repeat-containing protein [Verrucomicrobia bacterium]|jgi:hypothetical protein|nr:VCBS repeat-containing protein [Verrucomicrobiota bacterium]MBT7066085.1 VCBS repeat-containing protein [Verrucomicrobiota bacterium]MBT7700295.1 VCBS repeat-containing protein [Verrucomicrobiota bacterium]